MSSASQLETKLTLFLSYDEQELLQLMSETDFAAESGTYAEFVMKCAIAGFEPKYYKALFYWNRDKI